MKIKFIQKTTLVDYPGKIACTIFLFGCNFRCGFCYNPELVLKDELPDLNKEEVLRFLESRRRYLDGVCFTGGEPLMTLDETFLRDVKNLGYKIKIDTNGSFPEKLEGLISRNLVDFVSMDIKGAKEDYEKIVNAPFDFFKLEESIRLISSLPEYEFRMTVVDRFHDFPKVLDAIKWVYDISGKKIKKFSLQGFKNHGKFIDESFKDDKNASREKLEELKKEILKYGFVEEINIRV